MDILERADVVFRKSIREAKGYIELARMTHGSGGDDKPMREGALRALRRFTDDDELIDAWYDADMKEQEAEQEE